MRFWLKHFDSRFVGLSFGSRFLAQEFWLNIFCLKSLAQETDRRNSRENIPRPRWLNEFCCLMKHVEWDREGPIRVNRKAGGSRTYFHRLTLSRPGCNGHEGLGSTRPPDRNEGSLKYMKTTQFEEVGGWEKRTSQKGGGCLRRNRKGGESLRKSETDRRP